MAEKKIGIVILNYNCAKMTIECLDSIEKNNDPNLLLIVVDNASSDNSQEVLRSAASDRGFELICSARNGGFSEGSNIGIVRALSLGADWIHLLNPDTIVDSSFYRNVRHRLSTNPHVDVLGALGLYADNRQKIWFGGGFYDWLRGRGECLHQGKMQNEFNLDTLTGHTEFLTCACLLISRSAIENVGLLDTRYFLGGEEWDYSIRLKKAGYKLFFDAAIQYLHHVTGTHIKYSPKYIYNGFRTKLLFMKDQYPLLFPVWYFIYRMYTWILVKRKFSHLDGGLSWDSIKIAINSAETDARKYRSIELAHLQKFSN